MAPGKSNELPGKIGQEGFTLYCLSSGEAHDEIHTEKNLSLITVNPST